MIAVSLALVCGTASLLWICSEASRSLLYIPLYLIALLPGLPLGIALFGRRHAAAWISGGLLGYGLTAVTCSIAVHLGARTWVGFLAAWTVLMTITAAMRMIVRGPLISLPRWSRRDTVALLAVLLLVPALMWLPYAHNGAPDATGTRYYRAYFTADFVWHMALTSELKRLSLPPANPFFADQTMHYYWMYFMLPATGSAMLGTAGHLVEQCLELNAVLSGLLFVSAVFMATWVVMPRPGVVAVAVALGMIAASLQGWYGIYDLLRRGRPLTDLCELNIGALTNWVLRGLRIDALPRSLWWTPQHAMACAYGLIAVVAAGAAVRAMSIAAIVLIGTALGLSLMFSPLLGGVFALIYGLSVAIRVLGTRGAIGLLARHALTLVPVAAALAWCAVNQMFEGAGGALAFGWAGLARRAPLETMALALGPLLIPAVIGVLVPRFPAAAVPHLLGATVGVLLLYFVRLIPDEAWVGFRAGQILQITLPGLAAIGFARLLGAGGWVARLGTVFVGLLFVAGLPTTIIDVYNAQDTGNRGMSPGGFRWTIDITPDEQAAFDWIRRATPPESVVQMAPGPRGRETWTLIPSFAERRMGAGMALPLLENAALNRRLDSAKTVYATADAVEAWKVARDLKIDYVYLDRVERAAFAAGLTKFESSPYFEPVYRNDEVRIYAVQP